MSLKSDQLEILLSVKFLTKEVQTPKESIGTWLMCMVIVAESIPQWQNVQQNLNAGETLRR